MKELFEWMKILWPFAVIVLAGFILVTIWLSLKMALIIFISATLVFGTPAALISLYQSKPFKARHPKLHTAIFIFYVSTFILILITALFYPGASNKCMSGPHSYEECD